MPAKSTEQPAADKSTTAKKTSAKSTAQKTTRKKTTQKTTAKKTTKKKTDTEQLSGEPSPPSVSEQSLSPQQTLLEIPQENVAMVASQPQDPTTEKEDTALTVSPGAMTEPRTAQPPLQSLAQQNTAPQSPQSQTSPSGLAVGSAANFSVGELATGEIWAANAAIPALDEATYAAQKAQAEAQRRAIEVASLNLQNINDLHALERQSIDVSISAKTNETRSAQLTGAGIDHQTQLEINGEKSQYLAQAAAKHQSATRETGYADQLIALKDQNFELEIQQAQNVFAEKAARYRAQLTGQ